MVRVAVRHADVILSDWRHGETIGGAGEREKFAAKGEKGGMAAVVGAATLVEPVLLVGVRGAAVV